MKVLKALAGFLAILVPLAVMVAAVRVALREPPDSKAHPAPPGWRGRSDFQVRKDRSGRPVRQVRQGNGER